jgi:hypothetical protein
MTFNFLSSEDITTALIIYTMIATNNIIYVVKSLNTPILMLKILKLWVPTALFYYATIIMTFNRTLIVRNNK